MNNWKRRTQILTDRTFSRVHDRPEPRQTAATITRGSTIVGQMLEGIADKRHLTKRPGAVLARAGRVCWFLVQVATPHSLGSLLFRYWLVVLYLTGLVMVGAGLLGAEGAVLKFGLKFLLATLAVHCVVIVLNRWFRRRPFFRVAVACVALLALAAGIAFLVTRDKTLGLLENTVTLRQAGWAIPIAVLVLALVAGGWNTGRWLSRRGRQRFQMRRTKTRS